MGLPLQELGKQVGGGGFSFQDPDDSDIASIVVRYGDWLDSFTVNFTNGKPCTMVVQEEPTWMSSFSNRVKPSPASRFDTAITSMRFSSRRTDGGSGLSAARAGILTG